MTYKLNTEPERLFGCMSIFHGPISISSKIETLQSRKKWEAKFTSYILYKRFTHQLPSLPLSQTHAHSYMHGHAHSYMGRTSKTEICSPGSLKAFSATDTHTNMSLLYHFHVISTISNSKCSVITFFEQLYKLYAPQKKQLSPFLRKCSNNQWSCVAEHLLELFVKELHGNIWLSL